jgi:hypothetical protein
MAPTVLWGPFLSWRISFYNFEKYYYQLAINAKYIFNLFIFFSSKNKYRDQISPLFSFVEKYFLTGTVPENTGTVPENFHYLDATFFPIHL